jgi:hypothetical protein
MMGGWYAQRTSGRSARVVIALAVLALVLVALVPAAALAGLIMMLLGHVIGGLAVIGGSVLAAALAVALAGASGLRHARKLLSGEGFRVPGLSGDQYSAAAGPEGAEHPAHVVQLDRSDYTDVR